MNIFEGFEESNPQETADKLGIKKRNLTQNAKEDVLKVMQNGVVTWTKNYDLDNVASGMNARFDGDKAAYDAKGIDVDKNKKYRVRGIDKESSSLFIEDEEMPSIGIPVNAKDIYLIQEQLDYDNLKKRTRIENITIQGIKFDDIIHVGMQILYVSGNKDTTFKKCLKEVVDIAEDSVTVQQKEAPYKSVEIYKSQFEEAYAIHTNNKEGKIKKQDKMMEILGLSTEEWRNNDLWMESRDTHIDELKVGMKVRKRLEGIGLIGGYITDIDGGVIHTQYFEPFLGTQYMTDNKANFQVFEPDYKKIITDKNILKDDSKWRIGTQVYEIKEGCRYRGKSKLTGAMCCIKIMKIGYLGEIKAKHFGGTEEKLTRTDFIENFKVYIEDLPVLEDDTVLVNTDVKWIYVDKISNLKNGNRLRMKKDNGKWEFWKIIEVKHGEPKLVIIKNSTGEEKKLLEIDFIDKCQLFIEDNLDNKRPNALAEDDSRWIHVNDISVINLSTKVRMKNGNGKWELFKVTAISYQDPKNVVMENTLGEKIDLSDTEFLDQCEALIENLPTR